MSEDKIWIIQYYLNGDYSVSTIQLMANPVFDEVGKYTTEECKKVIAAIHSVDVPEFKKVHPWGALTLEEWDDYVKIVNLKIKESIL